MSELKEYKTVELTIPGEPIGKGRPRFSTQNGHIVAYTPASTRDYEHIIKQVYALQYHDEMQFTAKQPIELIIRAYYSIPKNTSKALRQKMDNGDVPVLKKPDVDNVVKIVCDALNGTAYPDDKQVISITASKEYSNDPRLEIKVYGDEYDG